MGPDAASTAHLALWWIHGIAALTFVAAIPFTKGVHIDVVASERQPPGRSSGH